MNHSLFIRYNRINEIIEDNYVQPLPKLQKRHHYSDLTDATRAVNSNNRHKRKILIAGFDHEKCAVSKFPVRNLMITLGVINHDRNQLIFPL
jgi:hypothetical protein